MEERSGRYSRVLFLFYLFFNLFFLSYFISGVSGVIPQRDQTDRLTLSELQFTAETSRIILVRTIASTILARAKCIIAAIFYHRLL